MQRQTGYEFSRTLKASHGEQDKFFWELYFAMMITPNASNLLASIEATMAGKGVTVEYVSGWANVGWWWETNTLKWDPSLTKWYDGSETWNLFGHPIVALVHELCHAYDDIFAEKLPEGMTTPQAEFHAIEAENHARRALYEKAPGCADLLPRPGYLQGDYTDGGKNPITWENYHYSMLKWSPD
jgi:hypothetical protein